MKINDRQVCIEKVRLQENGQFLSSDLIIPTNGQIIEFKSKPCNHDIRVDKLVYDIHGYPYDSRYCAVCDKFIDFI